MAFDYATLVGPKATEGSIKFWANHELVPSAQVLLESQAYIYARIRTREMLASATVTILSGASTFVLPERFIEPIRFVPFGWGEPLAYKHENLLRRYTDEDGALEIGEPTEWCVIDEVGTLDSQVDEELSGKMTYYKRPADLIETPPGDTNWLTIRYPTAVRYACMMVAYDHRKRRADATEMRALLENELLEINREADRGRRGQVRLP